MINKNSGVAFIRNEISKKLPEWRVIRDCLEGEVTIKKRGFQYLPYPTTNNDKCKNENDPRYVAYKDRANFMNITRRTVYELLAQVFIKQPLINSVDDEVMNLLLENASGNGISLEQCAKQSLKYALSYAYGGILVDFPENEIVSLKDYRSGVYRPTITPYAPFKIRNFRVTDIGVEERLSLVVLQESFWDYDEDGFEVTEKEQLRVLKLVDGEYQQSIWRSKNYDTSGKAIGGWEEVSSFTPKDANGKSINEIPFFFIGMENNNPYPDNPIMYDLATLNISHYRNSADYEEGMFIAGQPTLFVSGANTDRSANDSINLGSHNAIMMKNGGTAGLIQAKSDSGLAESMEKKEKAMAKFGAKFLETDNVAKTAYQVKVENPSQGSILANCADNVSKAYTKALKLAHSLCGLDPKDVEFVLNTDFEYNRVGTDEQNQIVNAWVAGAITFEEMRAVLRRAGTATEDDAVALEKIEKAQAKKLELDQKVAQINGANDKTKDKGATK